MRRTRPKSVKPVAEDIVQPKFQVGDRVYWTEAARQAFAAHRPHGPYTVVAIEDVLPEDILAGHPQWLVLDRLGAKWSGIHFKLAKPQAEVGPPPQSRELPDVPVGRPKWWWE